MTREELVKRVSGRLARSLNETEVKAIGVAWEILDQEGETEANEVSQRFEGANITLAEYEALPDKEKGRFLQEAKERNWEWIRRKFEELQAGWLMVVDGEVVAYGADLSSYPSQQNFLALCHRYNGKYPFPFIHPRLLAVEESTGWHSTTIAAVDRYPALPLVFASNGGRVSVEGDLDTGSWETIGDLDSLVAHGVVQMLPSDPRFTESHLGQAFDYTPYLLWIELTDEHQVTRRSQQNIVCVHSWSVNNPFLQINPSRSALIGRKVLLDLQPRVELDFETQTTKVYFPSP